MKLPQWWAKLGYAMLVIPVVGIAIGDTLLFAPITIGVLVGALGLAKEFKYL